MAALLEPRGPDGHGSWAEGPVALAHRRLKIIDLSEAGTQPMVDRELGLAVAFNGCIYNYQELRAELEADGYCVLLDQRHRGPAQGLPPLGARVRRPAARHVRLRDRRGGDGGAVVLGRDRLGIKPLYLAETDGALRFASTLPALLAGGGVDTSIDPVALHHYLTWHAVVPAPRTILAGVRKLEPGDADGRSSPTASGARRRYWRPSFSRDAARRRRARRGP